MRSFVFFCSGFILLTFTCIQKAQTFDGCICLEQIAEGLRLPTTLTNAHDGSNRLFVAEQYGAVHVYYPDGTKLPEPFINMSSTMGPMPDISSAGITSFEFHPDFKSNKLFYMLFSIPDTTGGMDHYDVLGEFSVSETDENKADPEYRELLRIPEPVYSHNANKLLFGVDGYLYIFVGDGGYQHDVHFYAQDITKLLGKVLRIDVNSRTGDLPYGIPVDNPFLHNTFARPEIYAIGFRNPWRCGIDSGDRETGEGLGRIICGDTGQADEEELDLIEKGANYGWNTFEGMFEHCSFCKQGPGHPMPPIFSYNRNEKMGSAVIGGEFYRGCLNPRLNGLYIYGDYTSGFMFGLSENNATGSWENKEIVMCDKSVCKDPLLNEHEQNIISFGKDEAGEVYVLAQVNRSPYHAGGYVYRIVDPTHPGDPTKCRTEADQKPAKEKQGPSPKVQVPTFIHQVIDELEIDGSQQADRNTAEENNVLSPNETDPTSKSKVPNDNGADIGLHQVVAVINKDENQLDHLTATEKTESLTKTSTSPSPTPTIPTKRTSTTTEVASIVKTAGNVNLDTRILNRVLNTDDVDSPTTTDSNPVGESSAGKNASTQNDNKENLRRKLTAIVEKLFGRFGGPAKQGTSNQVTETSKTTTMIGQEEENDDDLSQSIPSQVTESLRKSSTAQEEEEAHNLSESTPSKVTETLVTTTTGQEEEKGQDNPESMDSDEEDLNEFVLGRFKWRF